MTNAFSNETHYVVIKFLAISFDNFSKALSNCTGLCPDHSINSHLNRNYENCSVNNRIGGSD